MKCVEICSMAFYELLPDNCKYFRTSTCKPNLELGYLRFAILEMSVRQIITLFQVVKL